MIVTARFVRERLNTPGSGCDVQVLFNGGRVQRREGSELVEYVMCERDRRGNHKFRRSVISTDDDGGAL